MKSLVLQCCIVWVDDSITWVHEHEIYHPWEVPLCALFSYVGNAGMGKLSNRNRWNLYFMRCKTI
jgi:hypothetical protein